MRKLSSSTCVAPNNSIVRQWKGCSTGEKTFKAFSLVLIRLLLLPPLMVLLLLSYVWLVGTHPATSTKWSSSGSRSRANRVAKKNYNGSYRDFPNSLLMHLNNKMFVSLYFSNVCLSFSVQRRAFKSLCYFEGCAILIPSHHHSLTHSFIKSCAY